MPWSVGKELTDQAVEISTLAEASPTKRYPGNKFGSAPAAIAPTSPARLGIQPNLAPLPLISFATADNAPGVSAARSPTSTTDLFVNPVIELIAETSLPAAVLIKFTFNFSLPRLANAAMLVTLIERL